MSLILKNKHYFSYVVYSFLLFSGSSSYASTQSFLSKANVHGFVSQGVIQAKDSNFVNDSGDISAQLTEIGVNASYQLTDDFRVAGQAVYLNSGNRYNEGARIDYLLLDWSIFNTQNWKVNAFIGRFKNMHWLYSSERNVPMSRPSIVLPQSVYFDGTRDMSVGGDGVALSAKYNSDVFGDIDYNLSSGTTPISTKQTEIVMGDFAKGKIEHSADIQTSFYWQPVMSQWRFGLAYTGADFSYKNNETVRHPLDPESGLVQLKRIYANAIYQAEAWSISAEFLQETMKVDDLFIVPVKKVGQGGYVQGRYNIWPNVQILLRHERFFTDKEDKQGKKLAAVSQSPDYPYGVIPSYFGYQNASTIGLTYDFSASLKLQAEHHWYQGAARLTPLLIPNTALNQNKNWQLSAIQLTYWF